MAERDVCIIAGGMTKWGLREASLVDLTQEAVKECLDEVPGMTRKDIDGMLFASSYCGRTSFQVNMAPVVAERCGLKPTSMCTRVDTLCAGGNSGIILGAGMVKSGMADVMIIIGGEKLYTPQKWEAFFSELASLDHDWDSAHGMALPPPFFAMTAQEHMRKYGTTHKQLAHISVKNRRNAANNPKAQFQKAVALEDVVAARPIVPPLTLFDCCPVTDGAAAVILTTPDRAKNFTDRPLVYIRGTAQATLHSTAYNWAADNLGDWSNLRIAAKRAFDKARVGPDDIDVAQTHDCFTISEVCEMEDLGFCKKGEGGPFVESGGNDFGGKVPVNTDGGLLGCGHPFGGTGLRQSYETMKQLQGRAINQVKGAAIGLVHNLSGLNAEHTVLIYGREP
jgi:acetyl-CoA C-acetyltransferase